MDEDEQEKYEKIRSEASKNWMKPASVSLAKLDQVKASVYNVGLTDPKNLKAGVRVRSAGPVRADTSQNNANTQPPLSTVSMQKNAWGSNTAIPDLVRKQSDKQRSRVRPVSAQVTSKTRPISAKKKRPESAKEAGKHGGSGDNLRPKMGVKGAKYDPSERPPGGITHHSSSTGWVGPPGGVESMTQKEIETTLGDFMSGQLDTSELDAAKVSRPHVINLPPPAPRGSPDFDQMLQNGHASGKQGINTAVDDMLTKTRSPSEKCTSPKQPPPTPVGDTTVDPDYMSWSVDEGINKLVDGIIGDKKESQNNLLRRPTPEPIHFSLPTADTEEVEEDDEPDTARLIEDAQLNDGDDEEDEEEPPEEILDAPSSLEPSSPIEDLGKETFITSSFEGTLKMPGLHLGVESESDHEIETDEGVGLNTPLSSNRVVYGEMDDDFTYDDIPEDTESGTAEEDIEEIIQKDTARTRDRKLNVTFAEDRNVTVDITPRQSTTPVEEEQTLMIRMKVKGGKSEVRSFKNRIDSGSRVKSAKSIADRRKKVVTMAAREDQSQDDLSEPEDAQRASRPKTAASSRPRSALKATKISIAYLDDDGDSDDDDVSRKPVKQKKKIRSVPPEIESAVSKFAGQDSGAEGGQRSGSDGNKSESEPEEGRSMSRSSGVKNYYELSKLARPGHVADLSEDAMKNQPKYKTTKLIEFVNGGVKEVKSVSVMDGHINRITPRDPVARPERPITTRARPRSAKINTRTPPLRPTSVSEDRPGSRLGFLEGMEAENSDEDKEARENLTPEVEGLKKRRVGSATTYRAQKKPLRKRASSAQGTKEPEVHTCLCGHRSHSHHEKSTVISAKPSILEARRANAAARAMKEAKEDKEYETPAVYENYSRPVPPPVGLAKKKLEDEKKPKQIEIWHRREDWDVDTEGIRECKAIQAKLLEKGIPVALETLTRALLPPTDHAYYGPPETEEAKKVRLPKQTDGLLSKPSTWLADEFKRLQLARKAVRRATLRLLEQQMEERRQARAEEEQEARRRKKKKGKRGKGKKGKKKAQASS